MQHIHSLHTVECLQKTTCIEIISTAFSALTISGLNFQSKTVSMHITCQVINFKQKKKFRENMLYILFILPCCINLLVVFSTSFSSTELDFSYLQSKSMARCSDSGDRDSKDSPPVHTVNKEHLSSIVREISQARLISLRKRRSGQSMTLGISDNGNAETDRTIWIGMEYDYI